MSDLAIDSATATAPMSADLGRLLRPSGHYRHPRDVLADGTISVAEKRVILASWASDACAVDSHPTLRELPGTDLVTFDDVMDALGQLDARDGRVWGARIRRTPVHSMGRLFRPRRWWPTTGCAAP